MSEQYKDRYSKAAEELSEKNAFICESCQKKYDKEEAEKKSRTCCGKTLTEHMKEGSGP
jgi:predicted metal-binding protein